MLHPDIHFLDFILPPFHLGAPSVPASRFTKPCTHYPRTCLRLTALAHIFLLGWSCRLASSIWVTPCPRLLHPWARAQAHCLPCFDTSSLLYPLTLGAAFCLWGHDPSWPLYLLGYFCCCYPQVSLLRLHWKRWVDLQKYQKWFLHMAKLGEGGKWMVSLRNTGLDASSNIVIDTTQASLPGFGPCELWPEAGLLSLCVPVYLIG